MSLSTFDLNLRHLCGVSVVCASGAVKTAAERLNLSQPALSQGLAQLEQQFGVSLFQRLSDGMRPTAAGLGLAARVDEAMSHLARALNAVRRGAVSKDPHCFFTAAQLRALLALADTGGFTAAAALTGLSQPTLHRTVRGIELLVGVPLVERRGRGVALTGAGHNLARGFRLAASAIASGIAEIGVEAGKGGGTVIIGAMPRVRAKILPAAMAALHDAYPEVVMTVVEGAHRELIDQLRDGRIDLTIGALRDLSPGADVVQRPLFDDRLAIIARANHPLTMIGAASPAQLAAYPWVVGAPGTPLRILWERLFRGVAAPPVRINCGSVVTIRGLLLAGDYLTLLTPDQVWLELDSGLLALVGGPLKESLRTIGVTTRADWHPTTSQQAFLDILKRIATSRVAKNQ